MSINNQRQIVKFPLNLVLFARPTAIKEDTPARLAPGRLPQATLDGQPTHLTAYSRLLHVAQDLYWSTLLFYHDKHLSRRNTRLHTLINTILHDPTADHLTYALARFTAPCHDPAIEPSHDYPALAAELLTLAHGGPDHAITMVAHLLHYVAQTEQAIKTLMAHLGKV